MDYSQMQKFNPKKGERFIIIERGKPIMVVMSFEDYEKIEDSFSPKSDELETADDNEEDEEESERPEFEEEPSSQESLEPEDKKELTLEDLPF